MDNIKIPYLPYIIYNQTQAEELGLNYTEAILMSYFAYFLPNFGTVRNREGKNYYWMSYSKMFSDMPTLDFSESTLRKLINKMIKYELLERVIITEEFNKSRAFYRATELYLGKRKFTPFNFTTLYTNIENLLEEGKIYSEEKQKLTKLISSYKGKKKKNKTTYNFEGTWNTPILKYLKEELKLAEKGDGMDIDVGVEINKEYVNKNIIEAIVDNGQNYGWIKHKQGGEGYDLNDEVKGKILGNLKKMIQWLKCHPKKGTKTPVKNWKSNINTWFAKSWI